MLSQIGDFVINYPKVTYLMVAMFEVIGLLILALHIAMTNTCHS